MQERFLYVGSMRDGELYVLWGKARVGFAIVKVCLCRREEDRGWKGGRLRLARIGGYGGGERHDDEKKPDFEITRRGENQSDAFCRANLEKGW